MKKIIFSLLLLSLVVSCQAQTTQVPVQTAEAALTRSAAIATPEAVANESVQTAEPAATSNAIQDSTTISLREYFPSNDNVMRRFKGHGNEFLDMSIYTEYQKEDLVQFHTNNGGTSSIEVYSVSDDQVVLTYVEHEIYHRENMLRAKSPDQGRIILKTPLKVGEVWTNPDGSISEITQVGRKLETALGLIDTIVIQNGDSSYYYGKGYGLVRAEHKVGEELLYTQLSEFQKNTPNLEHFSMNAINAAGDGLQEQPADIPMLTNEVLRIKWAKTLVQTYPGLPQDLQINSLYKNRVDDMVYADFSKQITQANYGAGMESLMIDGIVRTLVEYFDAQGVYLWVDGGDYQSGHLLIPKNELLKPKQ